MPEFGTTRLISVTALNDKGITVSWIERLHPGGATINKSLQHHDSKDFIF